MNPRAISVAIVCSIAVLTVIGWTLFRSGDSPAGDEDTLENERGVGLESPLTHDSALGVAPGAAGDRAGGETISGTVLDSRGRPVAGVEVLCSALSPRKGAPVEPSPAASMVTETQGRFILSGLVGGEYRVETRERAEHVSARRDVMAPSEGLVLVLYEACEVSASGIVTDAQGRPLSDVEVAVVNGTAVKTGADGSYRLDVRVGKTPGSQLILSAKRPGYADRYKTVATGSLSSGMELDISFRLDEVEVGVLTGRLFDSEGRGVPGESIYLESQSRSTRYDSVSAEGGRFRLENILTAEDYRASVHPTSEYGDLVVDGIKITGGANRLNLELEKIETGVVNITLSDARGDPLPEFTVLIRSLSARANTLTATSDELGRFRATGVPAGDVLLETRTLPKVTVRGLALEPHQELSAEVSIGVGDRTVRGRVTHPDGTPVGGARVVVTWSWRTEWLRSSLFDEAVTRHDGRFAIAGFGPGSCSIAVSAVTVETARESFEIPPDGDPPPLAIEVR